MRKLPKIISKEEYEKLLVEALKVKGISKQKKKRYVLAMILAGEAGLRISEILGYENKIPPLTRGGVDFKGNKIFIEYGKGMKDRVVPLPKRFKETHLTLLPLNIKRRAFQDFLTKLGIRVLGKKISPHTLRHYFASRCAEKMPLHQLQMLLGHSRLDTTGIYLHANPKQAIDNAREVFG
jgi:integrase